MKCKGERPLNVNLQGFRKGLDISNVYTLDKRVLFQELNISIQGSQISTLAKHV